MDGGVIFDRSSILLFVEERGGWGYLKQVCLNFFTKIYSRNSRERLEDIVSDNCTDCKWYRKFNIASVMIQTLLVQKLYMFV